MRCNWNDNNFFSFIKYTLFSFRSKVYFNGTVSHAPTSDQYADNVTVFWMLPPYVTYKTLDHHPSLSYQETAEGPKFTVSLFIIKELHQYILILFQVRQLKTNNQHRE